MIPIENIREGDSGVGIPAVQPARFRPITEEEKQMHQQEVDRSIQEKAEAMLAQIQADEGWEIPRALRRVGTFILLAVAAVLGLFFVTQVVQFFADIQALPPGARWVAQGGLILFGGILIFLFFSLLLGMIRLQRSPRIHLKALVVLAERQELQAVVRQKQNEARIALETYLRDFALNGKQNRRFIAMGMTEAEWDSLEKAKARLLDSEHVKTSAEWLEEFERTVQILLDGCAKRRVAKYALRVGAGTAASPMAMVDQLIVLYGSSAMMKDLFQLYHLRPAAGQTVVLLAKSLTHTYLSGMVENATENAADVLAENLPEAGNALVGGGLRFAGAKAAEGVLNALLIRRLGRKAISLLQPVKI